MVKRFLAAFVALVILVVGVYSWQTWRNNRDVSPVERQQILASFEAAVGWFEDNREKILQTDNPALWWMVQQAANLTGDARLLELFDSYHERYMGAQRRSYWRLLFNKNGWVPVHYEQIESLDDYQQLFIYAVTCDSDLANIALISAQLDPSWCDAYPFRPSCVTHQLVGLHLMQDRKCGDVAQIRAAIEILQMRVRDQLVWDPRLLDPYLQRVLMLLQTGAAELIKPVWLRRVADGIQEDGGWPPTRLIMDLPGKNDLIFTRNFIGLGHSKSSFHTTAQGLLIMAHLLGNQ